MTGRELRCFGLAALLAASAGAQNLLANPDLDSGAAAWVLGQGASLIWTAADESDCPLSGSVAVMATGAGVTFAATNTCAELPGGAAAVSFALRYRGGGGGFTPMVGFYAGAGCSGTYLGAGGGATLPASPGAWSTAETADLAVPAGAVSALLIASSSGMSFFELDVDRAYLGVRPRVFADGFDADTPGPLHGCRWSLSAP